MTPYPNISGKSNIQAYEIGEDYIYVLFSNGQRYSYTDNSAGSQVVSEMKELALAGSGLASFINSNAKYSYE
jgi:hypothetical protein